MKQITLARMLQGIAVLAALLVLLLAVVVLPTLADEMVRSFPEYQRLRWPCLSFFWLSALPLFYALLLAWRIFADIGRDRSFCAENAARLARIGRLALLECGWYAAGIAILSVLRLFNPGLLLAGLAVVFAALAVATVAAALSYLVGKAVRLQQENDLTI